MNKPIRPRWQPVEDELMSGMDLPPLPQEPLEQEEGWQVVRHKRRGRAAPTPSPLPA